jgi:hypothetical protein
MLQVCPAYTGLPRKLFPQDLSHYALLSQVLRDQC